jgi:hypothetical protein
LYAPPRKGLSVLLVFAAMLGSGCADRADGPPVESQLQGIKGDPKIAFLAPANNVYFYQQEPSTPVAIVFSIKNWEELPSPDRDIAVYLDETLVATLDEGDSYEFENVPFGVHSLTLQLREESFPLANPEARAVRYVRITTNCLDDPECDEGNPCTINGCIYAGDGLYECGWGFVAGCCHTLFDCPVGTNHCGDVDGDGFSECVECLTHEECEDNNPCSDDLCTNGQCKNLPVANSCATDQDCDDGSPCTSESCDVALCACQYAPVDDCCLVDGECDDTNACTIDRCIFYVCRHGPKFFGKTCCSSDEDCVPNNPCHKGTCILTGGDAGTCSTASDPEKPGCCSTDAACPDLSEKWLGACLYNGDAAYYKCAHYLNPQWCEVDDYGLVLNEIMVNPLVVLDSLGEWVELYHAGPDQLDLSGYGLDGGEGEFCLLFPESSFPLSPGEFVTIARYGEAAGNGGIDVDFACGLNLSLENSVDSLTLVDGNGEVVDTVAWQPQLLPSPGETLARRSPYLPANDESSWQSGTAPYGDATNFGTPGEANLDLGPLAAPPMCDDGKPCTLDICSLETPNICGHAGKDYCCLDTASCDDGDACTIDTCSAKGICLHATLPSCCNDSAVCDDDDDCTADACINHVCRHGPKYFGEVCCTDDTDCESVNPCKLGYCEESICEFFSIDDCCAASWQCHDWNPCTEDVCNPLSHLCEYSAVAGCCEDAAMCEAAKIPEHYCRPSYCIAATCKYGPPTEGCCAMLADCDDDNPCTTDACDTGSHECVHEQTSPFCCNGDADCPAPTVPCTLASCQQNSCTYPAESGCCVSSAECDDGNLCTLDVCLGNVCHHAKSADDDCCMTSKDCLGDGLPCTTESCVAQSCMTSVQSPCYQTFNFYAPLDLAASLEEAGLLSFEGGNVTPGTPPAWQLTGDGALGPDRHLHLTVESGTTACLALPFLKLPTGVFALTLATDIAVTLDGGVVVAEVWGQKVTSPDSWQTHWTRVLPETSSGHHNITIPIVGPSQGYRRYAFCFKPFGASGTLELDSIAAAIGYPPAFLTHYPTVPVQVGSAALRNVRAYDPDEFPFQSPLTFALANVPSWITLGNVQVSKDGKTWLAPLQALATKIKGEGEFPVLLRVYDDMLYDSQTILVRALVGPCESDPDCADGNECTAEGCVGGKCIYQLLKPCCGDGNVDGVEQCDDGNAVPLDGCSPGCKLEDNDWDGLFDYDDNCPWLANYVQVDSDGDGFGDLCDPDLDGDGVPNDSDNCPNVANGGQYDNDWDGLGDWCDDDDDNDSALDDVDNCPLIVNPQQADFDMDGAGDICDPDDDNDSAVDDEDNCPFAANPFQGDLDGDGSGDACDDDADGDGYSLPLDCDDGNPGLFPILIDYQPQEGTNWRWQHELALSQELYFGGSPPGNVPRAPYRFVPGKETRLTSDKLDYLPLGATSNVVAWQVSGSDEGNVVLDHDGFFSWHTFTDLQADSVAMSGNAIGWLSGSGQETEVHLWKEGVNFTLTDNSHKESELTVTGSQMLWQRGGEIVHFTGQFAYDVTSDLTLDERPRAWGDDVVWVRHDGSAGSGNIVHMDLTSGVQTHLTKDSIEDLTAEMGGFGAAWKRKELTGKAVLTMWDRKDVSLAPTQPLDAIEDIAVGAHFVAWVGIQSGSRSLYVWDGTVAKTLDEHLPPNTHLTVHQDRLAWIAQDGPHLAAWVCTSLVDADGDGSIGADWGGDDCDDGSSAVLPGLTTIDLTMGATTDPGPPMAHLGRVAWSAHDGHDREVYFYNGKGILALTNNSFSDTDAYLHGGVVVWSADDGEQKKIMRYDGSNLLPVDGSAGGIRPAAWGDRTAWLTEAAGLYYLNLHTPDGGAHLLEEIPVKDGWYSLSANQLAYGTASVDSTIRVYNIATGIVTQLGQEFLADVEPVAFGETVVWRTKKTDWDVFLYQGGTVTELSNNLANDVEATVHQGRTAWLTQTESQSMAFLRHADGIVQPLAQSADSARQLSLGSPAVAWIRGTDENAELWLWDGEMVHQVTDDDIADSSPSASGHQVAWLHGSDVYLRKPTCGADLDDDGLINAKDNCPYIYNPNQADMDKDGQGDSCDSDDDGDLVLDPADNCPALQNPGQSDVDGDGFGNECDPDGDGDGYLSTTYGGDDCDDLDAQSIPIWTTVKISGGIPDNGAPEISGSAAVWHGTLFGTKQIFAYHDSTLFQLTSSPKTDENPSITDSLVVWEHDDGNDKEIWFSDLQTVSGLTNNENHDRRPRTDGTSIVWYGWDGKDYEIFHSDGNETSQLTYNGKNDYHPQVSGDLVVWRGFDGNDYEIFMKRGGAVYNISKNETDDGIPYIDEETVIWASHDGNDYEILLWEDEELKTLSNNNMDDLDPVIEDGRAIWRRDDGHDYEIVYFTGSVAVQLTNDDMDKGAPKMSNRRVVWSARTGIQDDWELYTHKGGKTVQITSNSLQDVNPAVYGDTIVWKCDNAICRTEKSCD